MAPKSDNAESDRGGSFMDSIRAAADELGIGDDSTFGHIPEGDDTEAASADTSSSDAPTEEKIEKIKVRSHERIKRSAQKDPQEAKTENEEPAEAEEVQQEDQAPEAEEVQVADDLPLPDFWDAEERALYSKAPAELKQIILAKEAHYKHYVARLQQERDTLQNVAAPFKQVAEEHKSHFTLRNTTPEQAFKAAIEWDREIHSHPIKGAAMFLRHIGVTPEQVHNFYSTGVLDDMPQAAAPIEDPRVTQLQQRLDAIEQSKQYEATQQRVATVQQFAQARDANGQPLRPHFDQFRPLIAAEAQRLEQINPSIDPNTLLQQAYEAAMQKVTGVVKPQADALERAKKAVKAQQSVAASRSGTSTGAVVSSLQGSQREKIEQIANRIGFKQH